MGVPLFCGAVFQVASVLQSGHCCCFSTNANPCNFARREVNYLPKWNDIGNTEVEGVSKLLLAHTAAFWSSQILNTYCAIKKKYLCDKLVRIQMFVELFPGWVYGAKKSVCLLRI